MPLIVIAEDESLISMVLTIMLEDAGFEVASAPHGKAALALIRERVPAIVITDFMMPLMTGLELAQAMRDDPDLSRIPIILTTGAQGSIGRANPEVFNVVLDKPYDEQKLISAVHALLNQADEI